MQTVAAVASIAGCVVLCVGAPTAIVLSVRARNVQQSANRQDAAPSGEVQAATTERRKQEVTGSGSGRRHRRRRASRRRRRPKGNDAVGSHSDDTQTTQFLLPTMSLATRVFGSAAYTCFVLTALLAAACIVLATIEQHGVAVRRVDAGLGTPMLVLNCTAALCLAVTALAPAAGRTTMIHIYAAIAFFVCGGAWATMSATLAFVASPSLPVALSVFRVIAVLFIMVGGVVSGTGAQMLKRARRVYAAAVDENKAAAAVSAHEAVEDDDFGTAYSKGAADPRLKSTSVLGAGQLTFGMGYALSLGLTFVDVLE